MIIGLTHWFVYLFIIKQHIMKKIYFLLFALLPLFAFAQFNVNYGNLTVFSEDGDRFYLYLNGEKQNDVPESNIRIEELPQPYYMAKIVFEDNTIKDIIKRNLMITDADGIFMEVTYKIKVDKKKKAKMNYFSMIPVQPDFVPPSGMYVHHFGHPVGGGVQPPTNPRNNGTIGASVNVPGMNVNISIQDPDGDVGLPPAQQQPPVRPTRPNNPPTSSASCMNRWPMSSADFNGAKNAIDESSFDETKLSTAKSIVSSNCLSTDQVIQLCNMFSFEDNKLEFAKFAYAYTTDPRNYFKVGTVLTYSTSKEELNRFIQSSSGR
jgi:hypothetical protein